MNDLREWTDQGQAATPGSGETIFAVASGAGVAGVAVIRISGPAADRCLSDLTGRPLPEPRYAVLRTLRDPDGEPLDEALVLRFLAGASYTGEPVVELHCHGGVAVVSRVLSRLSEMPGCRLAEAGEFTRRAFEAGRRDLAEIEALGDLLSAETEAQRRQAMRGYGGALHRLAESWRTDLIRALALVEVTIDWADEEVPEDVSPEVMDLVAGVLSGIENELRRAGATERVRSGFEVALVGAPNAGKSSLFNSFAGREAALTSPVPGTTRDVIELRFNLFGLPVIFLDMAGIRDANDAVEAMGVERARHRAAGAAIRVFLDAPDAPLGCLVDGLLQEGDLHVRTKGDISGEAGAVSVRTGVGLDGLLEDLNEVLRRRADEAGLVGSLRQQQALQEATALLKAGQGAVAAEILAEDLRGALRALERLIGRVGVEDVLEEVFSSFCLGK